MFKTSVNKLEEIISRRWGIETWIWGDMLIHPDEFPEMFPNHLHAGYGKGYGNSLRRALTKNITVVDWHYFGRTTKFTSGAKLKKHGFDVIGATWKGRNIIKSHSEWAAKNNYSGMIATSWRHLIPVDKQYNMKLMSEIMETSADQFIKDFE